MRISKWVDLGQEVEIDITAEDIRSALAEAFERVTEDRLGEEGPTRYDVTRAINGIAQFLNALTDEQIALLTPAQRSISADFFAKSSERFRDRTGNIPGSKIPWTDVRSVKTEGK